MKRQFNSLKGIIAIAIIGVAFTACKKDEVNTPAPVKVMSKSDSLSNKNWVMKSFFVDGEDYYSYMEDCDKDDFRMYKTNGTYIDDEGTLKCDSSSTKKNEGVWKLIENNTKMLIDSKDTLVIDYLTKDSLRVLSIFDDDGEIRNIKATFIAK